MLKPPRRKNTLKKKKVEDGEEREFKEQRYIRIIIEYMKEGYSHVWIKNQLAESKTDKLGTENINYYLNQAAAKISSEYSTNTLTLKAIHTKKYNDTINRLRQCEHLPKKGVGVSYSYQDWRDSVNRKIKEFDECLDTILQKEKCLQMHNKTFVLEINEEVNINVYAKKTEPDFSKLSFAEQIECLDLIKKAKKGEEEVQSVSAAKTDLNTSQIQEVEVISTILNVDQIKHKEPLVPIYRGELVTDPTAKLRAALQKLAMEKLDRDNPSTGIKVIDQKIVK